MRSGHQNRGYSVKAGASQLIPGMGDTQISLSGHHFFNKMGQNQGLENTCTHGCSRGLQRGEDRWPRLLDWFLTPLSLPVSCPWLLCARKHRPWESLLPYRRGRLNTVAPHPGRNGGAGPRFTLSANQETDFRLAKGTLVQSLVYYLHVASPERPGFHGPMKDCQLQFSLVYQMCAEHC